MTASGPTTTITPAPCFRNVSSPVDGPCHASGFEEHAVSAGGDKVHRRDPAEHPGWFGTDDPRRPG